MQESAQAAMSYVRSRAHRLGLPRDFYRNLDIHVHVPEGAIPKDGPSAGITMATAIASALSHIPVRRDIAMTGEITLRGKVLPIGGLKEKLLAAHRAGIMEVLLPADNEKDLADVPENLRNVMRLRFVNTMDDVLAYALERPLPEVPDEALRHRGAAADCGAGAGAPVSARLTTTSKRTGLAECGRACLLFVPTSHAPGAPGSGDIACMKVLTRFVTSAADPLQFPPAGAPEIAFLGRSNVGKSSLINSLVGSKIAKTSNTPGRTQTINFFQVRRPGKPQSRFRFRRPARLRLRSRAQRNHRAVGAVHQSVPGEARVAGAVPVAGGRHHSSAGA